jgi:hypothetical protein
MMISPQRHRDHRENSQFVAGDGRAPSPCPLCLGGANSCKTKPIARTGAPRRCPGGAGRHGARGTGHEGQMCQTNPIWPGRPARGPGGRESPTGHDGAKQSQFWPRQNEGQVVCGKGVMAHRTCNRLRQNKANFPPTAPEGRGMGEPPAEPALRRMAPNKPNLPAGPGGGGHASIVRHRLDAPLRETKPISGCGPGVEYPAFHYSIIPPF